MKVSRFFDGYNDRGQMPLGGYALILGAYATAVGGALWALARRDRLPRAVRFRDVALAGIATHKLTRTITRDWVTAPVRAAFTEYGGSLGHGEVREKSRGAGLRRALGDLVTCPYCTGPWVAGALLVGFAAAPRATRLLAGIFATVAVSDFLHKTYEPLGRGRSLTAASEGLPATSGANGQAAAST